LGKTDGAQARCAPSTGELGHQNKPEGSRAIEALEAEAEERHHAELEQAVARHPGEEEVPPPAAPSLDQLRGQAAERPAPATRATPKIGRNDPCPCGSGKKFKQCHGSVLEDEQATA
jgi:uncharacterized protein YecA (UPF0149 family)